MYYNRDLSWLEFNYRVLQEAACETVPLFERVRFLAIFSSNLNEFFSVRYPVVLAIANLKEKTQRKIIDNVPDNVLERIQEQIETHLSEFNLILTRQIIPALRQAGIVLYYDQPLQAQHEAEIKDLFLAKVLSFVQPVFLEGDVQDKIEPEASKLYMVISLKKEFHDELKHAIIKVPSDKLGRFFVLSPVDGRKYVIFIEDIIRRNASYIFPGFDVVGVYSIMLNRDADLGLEEDYKGNILKKIEKQLIKRKHGAPSRFLYEPGMPRNVQLYVASVFDIHHDEIFSGTRYHHLADLASLPDFDTHLNYEKWQPISLAKLAAKGDIFTIMEEQDMLLHFPYHSYNPVLAFFNQAAIDPAVCEIYITLYRLAPDSLIANALISAAKNGKRVTVFIELKARFDEANNVEWSKRMKSAGVHIIYSIPGIKVHTKIALVRKGDGKDKRSYALISTGNFNEMTAHFYADHTIFTTDKESTDELLLLFRFLESRRPPEGINNLGFKKLLVSQFNLVSRMEELVEGEIIKARESGNGLIRIKLNNLEEPGIIDLLYKASEAGVHIRLIVRSICCLMPGIAGISNNIKVKRLVDRYLEHTRIFIFGQDEDATVIIGSADWMTRNLYHRIEVCTPVNEKKSSKELIDYFELQWHEDDTVCAGSLPLPAAPQPHKAQEQIYNYLKQKP